MALETIPTIIVRPRNPANGASRRVFQDKMTLLKRWRQVASGAAVDGIDTSKRLATVYNGQDSTQQALPLIFRFLLFVLFLVLVLAPAKAHALERCTAAPGQAQPSFTAHGSAQPTSQATTATV